MKNNINLITPKVLEIELAKYIKSCARHLRSKKVIDLVFSFDYCNGYYEIHVPNSKKYYLSGEISVDTIRYIFATSFKDSGINGTMSVDRNNFSMHLTGKPVRSFAALQKLIKKLSGTEIHWNDITSLGSDLKVKYLCYDDELCKAALQYIRENKIFRDSLRVEIVEEDPNRKVLMVEILTPKGKCKASYKLEA